MEESVALDTSKQKDFVKRVRGIKKILKKKDIKPKETDVPIQDDEITQKKKFKKRRNRGLVYLSHIPHGFYEHQMTEYFKQFGVVTNARVIRSKRTGNSKGFAFVEFKDQAVAEIVADTMNNYLMGKRLIKAVYIPPEKQRKHAMRKKWNQQNNPAREQRLKFKKMNNAKKSEENELKIAKKLLSTLFNTKKKLNALGIEYDFFKPVDVPEVLRDKLDMNLNKTEVKSNEQIKNESKKVKIENVKQEMKNDNEGERTIKQKKEGKKKKLPKQTQIPTEKIEELQLKPGSITSSSKKKNKKDSAPQKKAKVDTQQNFISIDDDDSDSSIDFDSDEFEKTINDDEEISSGNDIGVSEDEIKVPILTKVHNKKTTSGGGKVQSHSKAQKTIVKQPLQNVKLISKRRENTQNRPVAPKKAKFEKKIKKPVKKIIKKTK